MSIISEDSDDVDDSDDDDDDSDVDDSALQWLIDDDQTCKKVERH